MVVYECDDTLAKNKVRIADAVRKWGGDETQVLTALAMAMAETQCCNSAARDASKDGTPSQNYSCFNMNKDMLQMAGWMGTPDLNDEANLENAVFYLMTAWHLWGVESTLNFHRGGRQAWQDGVSYGAGDYRAVIGAVVDYLRAHPETQTNKTRVGFNLEHV